MAKLIVRDRKLGLVGRKLVTDAGGAPCCCGGSGLECCDVSGGTCGRTDDLPPRLTGRTSHSQATCGYICAENCRVRSISRLDLPVIDDWGLEMRLANRCASVASDSESRSVATGEDTFICPNNYVDYRERHTLGARWSLVPTDTTVAPFPLGTLSHYRACIGTDDSISGPLLQINFVFDSLPDFGGDHIGVRRYEIYSGISIVDPSRWYLAVNLKDWTGTVTPSSSLFFTGGLTLGGACNPLAIRLNYLAIQTLEISDSGSWRQCAGNVFTSTYSTTHDLSLSGIGPCQGSRLAKTDPNQAMSIGVRTPAAVNWDADCGCQGGQG